MAIRLDPRTAHGAPAAATAAMAAVCAAAMAAIYAAAAHTSAGREIDEDLWAGRGSRTTGYHQAERVYDLVNPVSVAAAIAVLALVALALGRRREGVVAVLLVAGSVTSAALIKRALRVAEPDGIAAYTPSFPSAHAAAVFSIALAAVIVAPPAWRVLTGAAGAYACGVIGLAALIIHAHRISDLIGALLLTALWATGLLAAERATRPAGARADPAPAQQGWWSRPLLLAAVPLIAALSAAAFAALDERTELTARLVLGAAIPAGIAAALVGLLLTTALSGGQDSTRTRDRGLG